MAFDKSHKRPPWPRAQAEVALGGAPVCSAGALFLVGIHLWPQNGCFDTPIGATLVVIALAGAGTLALLGIWVWRSETDLCFLSHHRPLHFLQL